MARQTSGEAALYTAGASDRPAAYRRVASDDPEVQAGRFGDALMVWAAPTTRRATGSDGSTAAGALGRRSTSSGASAPRDAAGARRLRSDDPMVHS